MRSLDISKINSLKKLTELREAMLTAELSMVKASIVRKETEIARLQSQPSNAQSVDEIAAMARWQVWKGQELERLNAEHANLRADHDRCAQATGRAVAENAIVDHLEDVSQADAKKQKRKQAEETTLSHFLADNIGDQDV